MFPKKKIKGLIWDCFSEEKMKDEGAALGFVSEEKTRITDSESS